LGAIAADATSGRGPLNSAVSKMRLSLAALALATWVLGAAPSHADGNLHSLWELQGKHNTVYLLGSIHTLRAGDYPLAPAVMDAYKNAKALVMEINLDEAQAGDLQAQMLSSAMLAEGKSLQEIMGPTRYAHAQALAHDVGQDLSSFDQFAPWFVAEAISQVQLMQLGFDPQSGVEMYFLGRAHTDGKSIAGLETVQEQLAVFENMPMETQAQYLIASLEQAHDLPKQVDGMVHAWQRGDTGWFETELKSDLGRDPLVYQSLLLARNRKWISQIERLLNDDKNYLVIVGTAHLVGRDSVIELLKKDGFAAAQR
jgi:uncharacterized protein YbaP (TraB family)